MHHQAGASGDGGSSYIDLVAFRERDANTAWTSASDGTLEERLYYCQNQHADVVALITAAGAQREMARYSAYGVPFGLPVGDVSSDGDCDQADQNQVRDWALATPAVYDVRGDLDLDGDVDLTDRDTLRDTYKGVTLGRGVLSAGGVRNRWGFAAGENSAVAGAANHYFRQRLFSPALGAWSSQDALEYADGPSMYAYVRSNPVAGVDPLGTMSGPASGLGFKICLPLPKTGTVASTMRRTITLGRGKRDSIEIGFSVSGECKATGKLIVNAGCSSPSAAGCTWDCPELFFRFTYRVNGGDWKFVDELAGEKQYDRWDRIVRAVHGVGLVADSNNPGAMTLPPAPFVGLPLWSGPGHKWFPPLSRHRLKGQKVDVACPGDKTLRWTALTLLGRIQSEIELQC